tara:strand:+ start:22536 stop:22973 length:438 start_codon:yes stop_codon:yes gene_type:complete
VIVRAGAARDSAAALAIWRAAVDATHGFLSPEDRQAIDAQVSAFLPQSPLWVAEMDGEVAGFMVLDGDMIEALFVDPSRHGQGVGSALVAHALTLVPQARVDANEQADNAAAFYLAKGFERIGRSPCDHEGRPYPLVHFRFPAKA